MATNIPAAAGFWFNACRFAAGIEK